MRRLITIAGISLVAVLFVAVVTFTKNANNTSATCSAALGVRDAMIDVLKDAQRRTEAAPAETARERERAAARSFYIDSIRRLEKERCTK